MYWVTAIECEWTEIYTMKLSKIVQINNLRGKIHSVILCLLLTANVLGVFLYAHFSGFLRGESFAIAVYTDIHKYDGFFPEVPDMYQKFTENYLAIIFLLVGSLAIHLYTRKIVFKWFQLLILIAALYAYGQTFYLKLSVVQDFEFSRYKFMRDMFPFDIGFAILMILIVLSLIFALATEQKLIDSKQRLIESNNDN